MPNYNGNISVNDVNTEIDFKTINRAVTPGGQNAYQPTGIGQMASSASDNKTQKVVRWQVTNYTSDETIKYYAAIVHPANSATEQPVAEEKIINGIYIHPLETVVFAKEEQPFYITEGDLKDFGEVSGLRATYCYQEWTEA